MYSNYDWADTRNRKSYLKDVVSWPYICHVNPLTVDIMAICIPAAHRDPLVTHVIAGKPLLES